MVKEKVSLVSNLEEIKTRLRDLQELVNQLKSEAVGRAKSLEKIQHERLLLQQQLIILKTDLEQARGQILPLTSESRVIN
jgi:SMC interacting uncharacterized protein involved in chromosome segregation